MTISAEIVLDSISPAGIRLTTLKLRYNLFIHPELLTHRIFSRNASSSRAIPVHRLIRDVKHDIAMPTFWGRNRKGMQANEEQDVFVEIGNDQVPREEAWTHAAFNAIHMAEAFAAAGYHKQIVNRLLAPFVHINTLLTATHFENFFELRDHPDAQPEMQVLARMMREALDENAPDPCGWDDWHLPFITDEDIRDLEPYGTDAKEMLRRVSAARCARVSYLTHDGKRPNLHEDLQLFDRLITMRPLHASPTEHQASPCQGWCRNFLGWRQYRDILETEMLAA